MLNQMLENKYLLRSAWVTLAFLFDIYIYLQKSIASPGRGILAIDESNATCGKRLASIGLDNTETNRQAYRQLLLTTPGLGDYISGAILFEETLYQSTTGGKKFVDCLRDENIMPGIKVDKVCKLSGSGRKFCFVNIFLLVYEVTIETD